jgi:hypothetical protein
MVEAIFYVLRTAVAWLDLAAWLRFRRDRGGVLRLGIIGVFIVCGTKSKTSSSASKSISVSPPVMKNWPRLFSILSS